VIHKQPVLAGDSRAIVTTGHARAGRDRAARIGHRTGATPVDTGKQLSRHLRCDGNPPTVTGGESFARFVGAVTLLGIAVGGPTAAG